VAIIPEVVVMVAHSGAGIEEGLLSPDNEALGGAGAGFGAVAGNIVDEIAAERCLEQAAGRGDPVEEF
jgi:hypothetical protein